MEFWPMPAAQLPRMEMSRAERLEDETLIRLIMQYHDAHVRDLASAAHTAEIVAARHGPESGFPPALPDELARLRETLQAHQLREEAVLFPVILEGRGETLRYPIKALGSEHDDMQDGLERLVRLTGDYAAPAGACATWRALYDLLRKFDGEFREHVRLEERVLFPRFQ